MKNKKAISPIITTIMLILIAVAAVGIVWAVVYPLITEMLVKADCHKTLDQISILTESKYTCYYLEDNEDPATGKHYRANISVQRGNKPLGIEKFKVTIHGEGTSQSFEVINNGAVENVEMLNGDKVLVMPKVGEQKTYSFNTTELTTEVSYATIAPYLKAAGACEEADNQFINPC